MNAKKKTQTARDYRPGISMGGAQGEAFQDPWKVERIALFRDLARKRNWSMETDPLDNRITYRDSTGNHVVHDLEEKIVGDSGSDREIQMMLDVAGLKDWKTLMFNGLGDFVERAMEAAIVRGFQVEPENDAQKEILETVRSRLANSLSESAIQEETRETESPRETPLPEKEDLYPEDELSLN
jgi:hypothetical protein